MELLAAVVEVLAGHHGEVIADCHGEELAGRRGGVEGSSGGRSEVGEER